MTAFKTNEARVPRGAKKKKNGKTGATLISLAREKLASMAPFLPTTSIWKKKKDQASPPPPAQPRSVRFSLHEILLACGRPAPRQTPAAAVPGRRAAAPSSQRPLAAARFIFERVLDQGSFEFWTMGGGGERWEWRKGPSRLSPIVTTGFVFGLGRGEMDVAWWEGQAGGRKKACLGVRLSNCRGVAAACFYCCLFSSSLIGTGLRLGRLLLCSGESRTSCGRCVRVQGVVGDGGEKLPGYRPCRRSGEVSGRPVGSLFTVVVCEVKSCGSLACFS